MYLCLCLTECSGSSCFNIVIPPGASILDDIEWDILLHGKPVYCTVVLWICIFQDSDQGYPVDNHENANQYFNKLYDIR